MTAAVSVVIPSLGQTDLLERALPPLLAEADARAQGDEVIVVDDSGDGALVAWLANAYPTVRALAHESNLGFAATLRTGVEAAGRELVFSMNPDVVVRPGFLDPLVACMADEEVFAVAPKVLLDGDDGRIESWTRIALRDGEAHIVQPALEGPGEAPPAAPTDVAFAVGGTCLLRRAEFLATGGFDPLFEPFYWEDVDLCWSAQRDGRRVLYQPASVVEHHHRGTIGRVVGRDIVRAAIERNRILFRWKHLEGDAAAREHVAAMHRRAIDAHLADERDELVWMLLALDRLDDALAARRP